MILSKTQALEIALIAAPELQNKNIFKVTQEQPKSAHMLPEECWYIIYSAQDKGCSTFNSFRVIAISNATGELRYKGSIDK